LVKVWVAVIQTRHTATVSCNTWQYDHYQNSSFFQASTMDVYCLFK